MLLVEFSVLANRFGSFSTTTFYKGSSLHIQACVPMAGYKESYLSSLKCVKQPICVGFFSTGGNTLFGLEITHFVFGHFLCVTIYVDRWWVLLISAKKLSIQQI